MREAAQPRGIVSGDRNLDHTVASLTAAAEKGDGAAVGAFSRRWARRPGRILQMPAN